MSKRRMMDKGNSVFKACIAGIIALALGTSIVPAYGAEELNQDDLSEIASLPLPQARDRLSARIADLDRTLNMLENMERLGFEAPALKQDDGGNIPDDGSVLYTNNYSLLTLDELNRQLAQESDPPLSFHQIITPPSSRIQFYFGDLERLFEQASYEPGRDATPYYVSRVIFRDGSAQDFPQPQSEEDYRWLGAGPPLVLPVSKPIDRINVSIRYTAFTTLRKIVLTPEQPEVLGDNGERYQWAKRDDGRVTLRMILPQDAPYAVEGLNGGGRALHQNGWSGARMPTAQGVEQIKALRATLTEVRDNATRFHSSQELVEHLKAQQQRVISSASVPQDQVNSSISFAVAPQSLIIYLPSGEQKQTIAKELLNQLTQRDLYVANDENSRLQGLIDNSGAWIFPPRYQEIQDTAYPGIFRIQEGTIAVQGDDSQRVFGCYAADMAGRELTKLPFDDIVRDLGNDLLWVADGGREWFGIYQPKARRFVLPLEFRHPVLEDNLFIAARRDRSAGRKYLFGAYTLQGKQLLSPIYQQIEKSGNFLYAQQEKGGYDVFSLLGKKLTPDGYGALGEFVNDQPLLVRHKANNDFRLVTSAGALLPYKLPYDDVEPFSNGMAIVQKNDLFGAIDLHGRLSVPTIYKHIFKFQGKYAAARTTEIDDMVLIDRRNHVVKTLGLYRGIETDSDDNVVGYRAYDAEQKEDRIFNLDGEPVRE